MKQIILCDDCNTLKVLELAKNQNFGIEIQAFHKPVMCEDVSQIAIHQELIKGISPLSFHAPFADLCPGSSDPMVKAVARNRFDLAWKAAEQLGVTSMVFHIGWVPGAGVLKNWAGRCVDFWNEFLDGKPDNIVFYIENNLEHDSEMLALVIEGINRKNVKVCLDIGHAHCNSRTSVMEWVKTLENKIGCVHIHDNHAEKDEHLGLGMGTIPIVEVLNALNEQVPEAIWALEPKLEHMEDSFNWLKRNNFI